MEMQRRITIKGRGALVQPLNTTALQLQQGAVRSTSKTLHTQKSRGKTITEKEREREEKKKGERRGRDATRCMTPSPAPFCSSS